MILFKTIFILFILPFVDVKIYVFNTVDSPFVEFYDCILHDGLFYCLRPTEPTVLNRTNDTMECYHNGIAHSFANLSRNNVNISTVLHEWKSSIEKVEEYSRYISNTSEPDGYVCNCVEPQSFGKNCEYMLPVGKTFAETYTFEMSRKRYSPRYAQLHGDIVCYVTLKCNSGLLCLDWRDICDGVQQCMLGLDEENCDKLEFNECENDEYRCMNGMCIPEEYFLDGDFDCLDWSDEIQYYDDADCPLEGASIQCDDRICLPYKFSCGDGQCINDRFGFQKPSQIQSECRSRREQFYICETHFVRKMWTLPSGRCYEGSDYIEPNSNNRTNDTQCEYLLRCSLSRGLEAHCLCGRNSSCEEQMNDTCVSQDIQYPKAGIMAPYIFFIYQRTRYVFQYGPDFSWINGTIKCYGIPYQIPPFVRYPYVSTVHQVENALCRRAKNTYTFIHNGSDEYCYNRSLTFNNRSYSFSDVCNISKKCISTYRIKDGYANCVDKMDEISDNPNLTICSKMQRYRFRCSSIEPTCLSVTTLGNLQNECKNTFDEYWLGTSTPLADFNCNKLSKDQCEILRQYIENSWVSDDTNKPMEQFRIPFREYCNTFWNLVFKEDENITDCKKWWICAEEQWQCATGQCIYGKWVLDGEWDCFDGSDEDDLSNQLYIPRNMEVVPPLTIKNKSNNSTPFFLSCNLTIEFPCLPVNISNLLFNSSYNQPCISKHRIGDGNIDCYGAIDERNTKTHCNQPSMLGYHFKCMTADQCIPYWNHCLGDRCGNATDDQFWCDHRRDLPNCNGFSDAACFNGTCVQKGRCNQVLDCQFGEDEYMCEYKSLSRLTGILYRQEKEAAIKKTEQKLRLIRFPTGSDFHELMVDSGSTTSTTPKSSDNTTAQIIFSCNRGVAVEIYNGSTACFCPLQYYGDRCQFHSDRIILLLHLNFTRSIYTIDTDVNIVLKMVVLFLVNNEIITNHVFHVRPISELFTYTKKITHLLYSRSFRNNHSNDSSAEHFYSVRIEMYERQNFGEPLLNAVWQYPIYFHYLPVFRLAKVLRLITLTTKQNPCSSNPCNQYQDCLPLMNDLSKYICLCKANFTGENCSIEDQQCTNGYCLAGSICKPNYRGLLTGNHLPYCICSFDRYGERCHIRHDRCSSTPCLNNGSCYTTSKPDTFSCICSEKYHGKNCGLKKPDIMLYINESVNHAGAVVQYFDVDFISFNLLLAHQRVYQTLPKSLECRHGQTTAPEIILVKLYSSQLNIPAEIYVISIHVNVTSIIATTQIIEQNRCINIQTLISTDNNTEIITNYSPIKYHLLCQNNSNLFCFRDDYYLCICNENHSRVECFRYDSKLDQCSHCLSGGRCLKGDRNNFICLCPFCYSGRKCQFNSNSFSFTLDQLFFTDLTSINPKITFRLLIIIPLLLFLFAIPNNLFSIVTFRRQNCLCNGIGQYLFSMSIINQINLGLLAFRLIHLVINLTSHRSYPTLDDYLCKILSYLLTSSSRMVYWLSSLVAIERVYMTIFLNGRWLRKPHIARRLIIIIIICILISDIHELIFIKSLIGIHNDNGGMCVIQFPINYQSTLFLFHLIISIMNSILPLLINICCTITISFVVAKKKINTRKTVIMLNIKPTTTTKKSRLTIFRRNFQFICEVLRENKELVIGPGITLVPQLFSLPLFIISFTLYCQRLENSWMRYVLIGSYFTSFIPQLTSFLLYIYPSSFYSTEWHGTKISKWIYGFFRIKVPDKTVTKTSTTIE